MVVQDIIKEIWRLPLAEQRRIYESLSKSLSRDEPHEPEDLTTDDIDRRVQESLYSDGAVSEIKPPRDPRSRREYRLIEVEGEPLSETIIKERR